MILIRIVIMFHAIEIAAQDEHMRKYTMNYYPFLFFFNNQKFWTYSPSLLQVDKN